MARKKNTSGRPLGYTIDAGKLRERIEQKPTTFAKMAEEAKHFQKFPKSSTTYSRAIKQGRGSPELIEALCVFLGVVPDEFVNDTDFPLAVKRRILKTLGDLPRTRRTDQRTVYRRGQTVIPVQDPKNVIKDPFISQRLLDAEAPPSLYDAVLASKMQLSDRDEDKDRRPDDIEVNHYLSVGAVVTVRMPGDAQTYAVAVHRQRDKFPGDYRHTYGRSVLIGASFFFGLRVTPDPEMENWVYGVEQNPSGADDSFMKPPSSALFGLLAHKYRPYMDHRPRVTPLGVVTRDERPEAGKSHRVYTMYVFRIHTELDRPTVPRDRFAENVLVKPETGSVVAVTRATESLWVRENGARNLMDIVAWRGLTGRAAVEREEKAHFVRGFSLA